MFVCVYMEDEGISEKQSVGNVSSLLIKEFHINIFQFSVRSQKEFLHHLHEFSELLHYFDIDRDLATHQYV